LLRGQALKQESKGDSVSKSIGKVKWFDNAKGYGFILNQDNEDVFVHYRAIIGDGYKSLNEGEEVEFIQTRSEKGWQAAEVGRMLVEEG
jgi:CspA family cold shock protein